MMNSQMIIQVCYLSIYIKSNVCLCLGVSLCVLLFKFLFLNYLKLFYHLYFLKEIFQKGKKIDKILQNKIHGS